MNKSSQPKTKPAVPTTEHVAPAAVRRGHFRLRLWHGLVLILIIVIIGVIVVRLSRASSDTLQAQTPAVITSGDVSRYAAQFGLSSTNASAPAVAGEVVLHYSPKGAAQVSYVAYYVDLSLRATTRAPYNYVLNTTALTNGSHQVTAVAYDASSIVVGFSNQTLTVQNNSGFNVIRNSLEYPWQVIFGNN